MEENKNEDGYLNLVKKIISHGELREGRNGKTKSLFGPQLRFDLVSEDGDCVLPLLTTKRVPYRLVLEELKWFSQGKTDNKTLLEKNVRIWKPNADAGPLWKGSDPSMGDLGPIYGFQWRHFGAEYKGFKTYDVDEEFGNPRSSYPYKSSQYDNKGVDQLRNIVKELRENPGSRRAVMSAWNPVDLPKMTLPPCHVLSQYWIGKEGLYCHLYQRSADIGLGVPFNIASYATLAHMIAKCLKIPARELVMSFGDCHIYEDHIDALTEQCKREPRSFPKMIFRDDIPSEELWPDTLLCEYDDLFEIIGYEPHKKIKMDMIA